MSGSVSAAVAKKAAAKKAAPAKAAAKKAPARKSAKAAPKRPTSRSRRYAKSRKKYVAPRPATQMRPAPERYREIQQALIDRGYLSGEASGEWTPDSVAALKRFQQDQRLDGNGKLDALSLIALGLGPKRVASAEAAPSTQQ